MSDLTNDEEAASAAQLDNKERRDAEVLRLWNAGWSRKKIAEHLDIKTSTVAGVVQAHKAERKPYDSRAITVSPKEQQVMRHLEQAVEDAVSAAELRKRRDEEILWLWRAEWSGRRIAEHLNIKTSTVAGVVHAHKAARNPRGSQKTISLQEAPVAAWRQAMLPELEQDIDDTFGATGATKRVLIFMSLLQMKEYDEIEWFKAWAHEVTGYDPEEITSFVERGIEGFLIVDGQPNAAAFDAAATKEHGDFAFIMMAKVFEGEFCRSKDDEYFLPQQAV